MNHNHLPAMPAEPFEVEIEKLVYGGEGLGRRQGKVVFVAFTAPGDIVEVRPIEQKKGFIRAVMTRILKPGPGRRSAPCPHFGRCGGCQWQHLDYALQVETKRRTLKEGFHHRFPETRKLQISMQACPSPYGYRSRARVQLRRAGEQSTIGFFRYRSHQIEDVSICPLFSPPLGEALSGVRRDHHDGHFGSGEQELELACAADGTWTCAAAEPANLPAAEPSQDTLMKQVHEFVYASAASVFFQANEFMLGELIATVMKLTPGGASSLDLFSGVGFFSLPLARRYRQVVCVESSPRAHHLCSRNATHAGLENIRAVCADVPAWMEAMGSIASPAFNLILLDPPRTGVGPEVMKHLTEWAPESIIYVSCDVQTLLRDLTVMPARDYRIDSVDGLDLFPQTYHFETIVRLRRR